MPRELSIRESDRALVVIVRHRFSSLNAAFAAIVTGGACVIFFRSLLEARLLAVLTVLCVLFSSLLASQTGTTRLIVTNLELRTTAGASMFLRARLVSRADIRWIEFREDTRGVDGGVAGGLYAVVRNRGVCLLPEIERAACETIIDRIFEKFPDFKEQCSKESPFGESMITLGLDA